MQGLFLSSLFQPRLAVLKAFSTMVSAALALFMRAAWRLITLYVILARTGYVILQGYIISSILSLAMG